jgi:hypothetical protein
LEELIKRGIDMPSLFSYVLAHDRGFAPNPHYGYCTLACCKPVVRRSAEVGDWVVGTGSANNVGHDKLVYAMRVTEKLTFEEYSRDPRFKRKIPKPGAVSERGDNIYYKGKNGRWKQREGYHKEKHMKHDLSGKYVLISDHYYYFGGEAVTIPKRFRGVIKKGPGHKCRFEEGFVVRFFGWLEGKYEPGLMGNPSNASKCEE